MQGNWIRQALEILQAAPAGPVLFDADYTLWQDDVAGLAWNRVLAEERLRPEATAAIAEELVAIGAQPRFEAHADARMLMELHGHGAVSDAAMIDVMTTCFAGWSELELLELGRSLGQAPLAGLMYEGARELVEELRREGRRVVLISASPFWLVQGAVEALDLVFDKVIGTRTVLKDGRLTGQMQRPSSFHEGKAEVWREHVRAESLKLDPVAAFSDSVSDVPLLELASHLRGAVNPSPALAAQVQAKGRPWQRLQPEFLVSGRKVTRRAAETVT